MRSDAEFTFQTRITGDPALDPYADLFSRRHKKRRLGRLKTKLAALLKGQEQGTVRLAFGSSKLWQAQYNLGVNRYRSY